MFSEKVVKALKCAENEGCTFADVRAEKLQVTNIIADNGELKRNTSGIQEKMGLRSIYKGAQGFSATTFFTEEYIQGIAQKSVNHAKAVKSTLKKDEEHITLAASRPVKDKVKIFVKKPLIHEEISRKVSLVSEFSECFKKTRGVSFQVRYMDMAGEHIFGSTDGAEVISDVSKAIIAISFKVIRNKRIGSIEEFIGGDGGFESIEKIDIPKVTESIVTRAIHRTSIKNPSNGVHTVILGPKACGVLAHEVIGHCCEADLIIGGEASFGDFLSKPLASELVTIVDDPLVNNQWGSMLYDHEGVPAQKNILLRKGLLNSYLHTRETAGSMKMNLTGNARSPDALFIPIPRMSNTYIEKGTSSKSEVIEEVNNGLLIESSPSANVNTTSGMFQLNGTEVFMIRKGEVCEPLSNIQIYGNIFEAFKEVDMVSDKVEISPGFCRKRGQTVMVSYGGPYVRIGEINVRVPYV